MADLAQHAADYVNGKKAEWDNLVDIAIALGPKQLDRGAERLAKLSGVDKRAVRKKIEAIRFKHEQGWEAAAIKSEGQAATCASYVKTKVKARTEPLVNFPHRLTPEIRDAVESLGQRIAAELRLRNHRKEVTWDQVFEFITADYATISNEGLKHLGGGDECEDAKRWARKWYARRKSRA